MPVHPHACGDNSSSALHISKPWRFTPTRVGTTARVIGRETTFTVHPHACGDNAGFGLLSLCLFRFTPTRVGTTHARHVSAPEASRFTPTRVGTTTCRARFGARLPVHPHACGDNVRAGHSKQRQYGSPPRVWGQLKPLPLNVFALIGSPPRVWGQHTPRMCGAAPLRFTPTRVGTTRDNYGTKPPSRFTPTRVGTTNHSPLIIATTNGSPPRVWGQRRRCTRANRPSAVHPHACGDNWYTSFWCVKRWTVHPHACGDNAFILIDEGGQYGSPPRVWGQLAVLGSPSFTSRFTPTRVGTTSFPAASASASSVHPHACGDNAAGKCFWSILYRFTPTRVGTTRGSPARALAGHRFTPTRVGTTLQRVLGRRAHRFTPTRVGTTFFPAVSTGLSPVHPHACGDNPLRQAHRIRLTGSPPRVWGQRSGCAHSVFCLPVHPHACGDNGRHARNCPRTQPVHPHACGDNTKSAP